MSDATVLRAERWVDVEAGEVRSPAVVVVDGQSDRRPSILRRPSCRAPPPRSTSAT